MKATIVYRLCLIVGTSLYAYYWLLPYSSAQIDPYIEGMMSNIGAGARITFNDVQAQMLFGAWILAALGMFFYMRYARDLFLTLLFISTAMSPFLGLNVQTGPESALLSVANVCDGVVLALAYFSPVRERFGRVPNGATASN